MEYCCDGWWGVVMMMTLIDTYTWKCLVGGPCVCSKHLRPCAKLWSPAFPGWPNMLSDIQPPKCSNLSISAFSHSLSQRCQFCWGGLSERCKNRLSTIIYLFIYLFIFGSFQKFFTQGKGPNARWGSNMWSPQAWVLYLIGNPFWCPRVEWLVSEHLRTQSS